MSERSLTVVADSVRASIGCRLGAFTNEDASTVNHEGINRTNCLFNLVGVRDGGKLPPLGTVADSVRASLGCVQTGGALRGHPSPTGTVGDIPQLGSKPQPAPVMY